MEEKIWLTQAPDVWCSGVLFLEKALCLKLWYYAWIHLQAMELENLT